MSYILETKNINKFFGKEKPFHVLKDIYMGVQKGEFTSIMGKSGSGKSTLLKAIFSLVDIMGGEINYLDSDLTKITTDQMIKKGLSFVPQTDNVFPTLTVEENLELGAYVSKKKLKDRFELIYNLFPPLVEKRKKKAGT